MTKIEHIQKLLAFIETGLLTPTKRFFAPSPLPSELRGALAGRMRDSTMLDDRDAVEISFDPKLQQISIYSALEDRRRRDYDKRSEEVPVFDEFLDFAISVLRNRVHDVVLAQIEAEESQRKRLRVEARMKELGL